MNRDQIKWGEWGIYSYKQFIADYLKSEEFKKAPMGGYQSLDSMISSLLTDDAMGSDSLDFHGPAALFSFAVKKVPHRVEDATHISNVYNPQRDCREGAKPSIPKQGPDIFKNILEGDPAKGHAIISSFDQDNSIEPDDLYTDIVESRKLIETDAHSVSIVNKFPSYVRIMDDDLVKLMQAIGFISDDRYNYGKPAVIRTIPFGLNFVSFPYDYYENLSSISVFSLYTTLSAAQKSLKRAMKNTKDPVYDVFFNFKELAGGTLPRLHMQTYLRTSRNRNETYSYQPEGLISQKDLPKNDTVALEPGNRSWSPYAPLVKQGKFDIRFELNNEHNVGFADLSEKQLFDLSEMLVYHSNVLDAAVGIDARNVQFYPTGIVIKPFAVVGGHEQMLNEKIYGQSSQDFGYLYNKISLGKKTGIYCEPKDERGKSDFLRLVDNNSSILERVA